MMVHRIWILSCDAVKRQRRSDIFQRSYITGDAIWILRQPIQRANSMRLRQEGQPWKHITGDARYRQKWKMRSSTGCTGQFMNGRRSRLSQSWFRIRIIAGIWMYACAQFWINLFIAILRSSLLKITAPSRKLLIIILRYRQSMPMCVWFITKADLTSPKSTILERKRQKEVIICS